VVDADLMSEPNEPDPGVAACFTRDEAALIASVDATITEVLGWAPEELVGKPSTDFIHPEDQPSAIAAWFGMLEAPGDARIWRGRYRGADGHWQWVETLNVNRLADVDAPFVFSTMTRIAVDEVSAEEELRARTQLLSRLSDALPVGLFQIDEQRRITFTNDQLHAIVGCPPAATAAAQFATLVPEDRALVDDLLGSVLANRPVDDIDVRLLVPQGGEGPGTGAERVCVLAMRPLTDGAGEVSGAIGCVSDITERVQLRRELEARASVDPLTSCLNRGSTLELLTSIIGHQAESGAPTAIMFVDLNEFKQVNDSLGHAAGDTVLEIAARRLAGALRDGDHLGRIGGDEFLAICPDVESSARALGIGERIARALTTAVAIGNASVQLRAAVGVAWTGEPLEADAFVAQADIAMYEAKCTRDSAAVLSMSGTAGTAPLQAVRPGSPGRG
jgi:diguanylate cyclase (GGDEF)-like protein/PAS domain S-box-containing protein